MRTERLIARDGSVLHYGVLVHVDGYEEAISIPKSQLDSWVYGDKLLIIRGMSNLSQTEFWELSTKFGSGAWSREDYKVGCESCVEIFPGDSRVYAHYSNTGTTAKAIGDGDMSWHVDIPLWPTHQAPLRSFYAVSIPDNNCGITSFADRAWGYSNMTVEQQKEASRWELLYQSWYQPGTNLTYLPVVGVSPYDGVRYLQYTSFGNSSKKYSHRWYGWKTHGWILGAKRDGEPKTADYTSTLHDYTLYDSNIFDLKWEEQDFAIWNNVHMIHSRSALNSELHTKPRTFYRMNMFNLWQ